MDSSIKHLLSLGREHFTRNDFRAAEGPLRTCVDKVPAMADVHFMLGVIHHDRGELAEARECFERALEINPEYTDAALSLSITCNELGRYTEARAVSVGISQRTRQSDRIDPFARGKLANLHGVVARAYEELGLNPEAADEYERALALCPSFADLRTRRAAVLRAMGEQEAALRELDVAVLHAPDYARAHASRGLSLLSLGRKDEARKAWERALALEPKNRAAKVFLRMLDRPDGSVSMPPIPLEDADADAFELKLLDDTDAS